MNVAENYLMSRGSGGLLKLRKISKISYLWYYFGRYLNVVFKFSSISWYGPALVRRGGGGQKESEPLISSAIGRNAHDVSLGKLCDWLVKSPHSLLPTAKSSGTSLIM